MKRSLWIAAVAAQCLLAGTMWAEETVRQALIRDVTTVEGVRENPVIGYGLVVGLRGTGDSRQTVFATQTLANVLQRMGVQIPAGSARVNNVAAVFVTANLPAFSRAGTALDVTVSSVGDAKSLEGGLLLLTPLHGADGQVYAAAQGPITVGGYSAGVAGNLKQVNHPTVGRIPNGGQVERDVALDLNKLPRLSLLLREPNFSTAEEVASTINRELGTTLASAHDSLRVDIDTSAWTAGSVPAAAVWRVPAASAVTPVPRVAPMAPASRHDSFQPTTVVVAIGTSTGGPKALQEILPLLPKDLPVGVLVVQHMPVGFTGPFARRLDNLCQISVREAAQGDLIEPGVVYIAPAGWQMTVSRRSSSKFGIRLSAGARNDLHVPSVDVMMVSVAEIFHSLAMGIIMTGMGADGARGMEAIRDEGGLTVGQDELSCTVYGMPRSCAELGVLKRVVPLMQIPQQIMQAVGYRRRQ